MSRVSDIEFDAIARPKVRGVYKKKIQVLVGVEVPEQNIPRERIRRGRLAAVDRVREAYENLSESPTVRINVDKIKVTGRLGRCAGAKVDEDEVVLSITSATGGLKLPLETESAGPRVSWTVFE